jgi:DNA processing protein
MLPPRSWLEGLLLPASGYRDFVESLLDRRPLAEETALALAQKGRAEERAAWVETVIARVERAGGTVLCPDDPAYPRRLLQLDQPPPALFARGSVEILRDARAVGVVGARKASPASRIAAESLGHALAGAGIPVVSGLARGVDSASHRGCLRGGGSPIAVLGTALDAVYPSEHAALQEEVARKGCLVSEVPPTDAPRAWRFLARNRIIAALSRAVVVIEAASRSGSLSTVEFAQELDQSVLVYPGAFDDPSFTGSNRLLRQGLPMVGSAAEVFEELGLDHPSAGPVAPLGLDRPRSPSEIARIEGLELGRVLAELAQLELEGRVRRVEGGRYVAVPGAG